MKKNGIKFFAMTMAASMFLAGCSTQIGKKEAESVAQSEAQSVASTTKAADVCDCEVGLDDSTTDTKVEKSDSEIEFSPLVLSKEEEEAWKKEPAYGKSIKIGYNGGLCLGTFGMALEKGFYEAEGLKAEAVKMTGQTDALGTGKVDVAGDHIATLLVPAVNGVNMVFTRGCHTGCKSLYVLGNSDIKDTSGLIGKTIAIADGIGASDHNISLRFLSHDNIKPEDVNFKVVGYDAVILALQNGEVNAATLSDQFARKFIEDGTLRSIRSLTTDEDFGKEPCCVHAVNGDFARENPITVKKLTHAHEEAGKWIEHNKEDFVDTMMAMQWASGDRDKVLAFANSLNFVVEDDTTEKTLENIINDYKDFGLIDASKDSKEVLNKIWDPVLNK